MLETEDIDDDYFTPASSTSLANIFGKSRKDDGTENESLKYTPPKPGKPEDTKPSECIYACAVLGYEWCNDAYVPKGKLGFAIIKITKTGIHNIVLYDSNKITLSCATVSTVFKITIKENSFMSYHDNLQKYWSLNATEDETVKVIAVLKSLNAIINYSSEEVKGMPETSVSKTAYAVDDHNIKEDKESDTDSSINRRTKMSILNRMASMGQSVLPTRTVSTEKTSDSSDTNDSSHYKTVRHKPVKSSIKRINSDKNLNECQSLVEHERPTSSIIEHSNNSSPLFTYVNGQLMPVTNTNILTSSSFTSGNDLSLFMSEQRVSNSEIRINMNRMTDKVDQILGKLSNLEPKAEISNNFQMDILQKLLGEYENKIKMYEAFIKSQDLDKKLGSHFETVSQDTKAAKSENEASVEVKRLELLNKENEEKINELETKLRLLKENFDSSVDNAKKYSAELLEEIDDLKLDLDTKNRELSENFKRFEEMASKEEDDNIGNKIKALMNETFRAISSNFVNDEQYSGEHVKSIAAAVIKRVTIESLNT